MIRLVGVYWPKEGESARLSSFSYMGWAIGFN